MPVRPSTVALVAALPWAQVAGAETVASQSEAYAAAAEGCAVSDDWSCAFDNSMLVMDDRIGQGETCSTVKGDSPDASSACGFELVILHEYALKAATGAEPVRRREIAERFLNFFEGYKVAEALPPTGFDTVLPMVLGVQAVRLEACKALDDVACLNESAASITNLVGDKGPEAISEATRIGARTDIFPMDLDAVIREARELTKGSQP